MRKEPLLFALLIGIVSISCTSVEMQVSDNDTEGATLFTKSSSLSTSIVGQSDFVVTEADVRYFVQRQKDSRRIQSIDPVVRGGDALLYVVNFADGWAIYSADKHLPPVLAKGQTGSFQLDGLDNPGVLQWMENMMDVTRKVRQETMAESANENTDVWNGYAKKNNETNTPERTEYLWTKVLVSSIQEEIDTVKRGPYLQTKWGQGKPWNSNLVYSGTNCFQTGCVAVALSQLLYYFHNAMGVPTGLYHGVSVSGWTSHNNGQYYTSTLNRTDYTSPSPRWVQMPLDSCSISEASYIADLMADVGNRVNMQYTINYGSSSTIYDAQAGLSYYGLTGNIQTFSNSLAYNEIAVNNRPFYMRGGEPPLGRGHAWVIDGIDKFRVKTTNTYEWYLGYLPGVLPLGEPKTQEEAIEAALEAGYEEPEDLMVTYEVFYTNPFTYYHFNWGWGGKKNGDYSLTPTIEINGTSHTFNLDQQMIYNIHAN